MNNKFFRKASSDMFPGMELNPYNQDMSRTFSGKSTKANPSVTSASINSINNGLSKAVKPVSTFLNTQADRIMDSTPAEGTENLPAYPSYSWMPEGGALQKSMIALAEAGHNFGPYVRRVAEGIGNGILSTPAMVKYLATGKPVSTAAGAPLTALRKSVGASLLTGDANKQLQDNFTIKPHYRQTTKGLMQLYDDAAHTYSGGLASAWLMGKFLKPMAALPFAKKIPYVVPFLTKSVSAATAIPSLPGSTKD